MKLKMFSVLDGAVGAHLQPFFARSEAEAVRMLRQAVNDKNTAFNSNPSDYTLIYVADFDDETAQISGDISRLINLSSLVALPTDPLAQMPFGPNGS